MAFQSGIFFDNEEVHITAFNTNTAITSIKVNDTHGTFAQKYPTVELDTYIKTKGFQDNLWALFLKDFRIKLENYDEDSGITPDNIKTLMDWVNNPENPEPKVAIFDWDRTLTKFEGATLPTKSSIGLLETISDMYDKQKLVPKRAITLEDALIFLCGGSARLAQIRDMFTFLRNKGVHITILTNSATALNATVILRDLLGGLTGTDDFTLLCSVNYGQNPIRKVLALRKDSRFNLISQPAPAMPYKKLGGGGHKISSKRRSKTKKSRKTLRRKIRATNA